MKLEEYFRNDFEVYEKKRERYESFFEKDSLERKDRVGFYCEEVEEEEEIFGQTENERWESWNERLTSTDIKKINRTFKKIDKHISEQELFGDRLKKMELLYKENEISGEVAVRKIRNGNQRRERRDVLYPKQKRVEYNDNELIVSFTEFVWEDGK